MYGINTNMYSYAYIIVFNGECEQVIRFLCHLYFLSRPPRAMFNIITFDMALLLTIPLSSDSRTTTFGSSSTKITLYRRSHYCCPIFFTEK